MKKIVPVIFIMIFILVGCAKHPEVTIAPTGEISSAPTETATPTNTPKPTETPAPTGSPTPIIIKMPTATPTPTPFDMSFVYEDKGEQYGKVKAELRDKFNAIARYKVYYSIPVDYSTIPFRKSENAGQKKINQELTAIKNKIANRQIVPALNGLKLYEARAKEKSIDSNFSFRCTEGIFTGIFINRYFFLTDAGITEYHYNYYVNFNMESGEKLKLRDLFYNDVDYLQVIRDCAVRYLLRDNARDNNIIFNDRDISDLDIMNAIQKISEDQMFSVHKNQIEIILDLLDVQVSIPIYNADFLQYGTLHIVNPNSPVLVAAPTPMPDCPDEYGIEKSEYSQYITSSEKNVCDIASVRLSDDRILTFYSKVNQALEPLTITDIAKMLNDTDSRLRKNVSGIKASPCFLSEFTLDNLVVIETDRSYTFFEKETLKPLEICVYKDNPSSFFKAGVNVKSVIREELERELKEKNRFSDEDIKEYLSIVMNYLYSVSVLQDGTFVITFTDKENPRGQSWCDICDKWCGAVDMEHYISEKFGMTRYRSYTIENEIHWDNTDVLSFH